MSINFSDAVQHLEQAFTLPQFTSVFISGMSGVGLYEIIITGASYSLCFILQIEQFNTDPLFRPFVGSSPGIASAARNAASNQVRLTTPLGENVVFNVDNNNGDLLIGTQSGLTQLKVIVNKI